MTIVFGEILGLKEGVEDIGIAYYLIASYPRGTKGSFPGGKAVGEWS
jgi:hypothetical protein